MMKPKENWKEIFAAQEQDSLRTFFEFLSFPSISSEPESRQGIEDCANWLYQQISSIGFTVEKWATAGHPILFASCLEAGPHCPTLLIYNHYDVQPVDPLEEWRTPPFQPTLKEGVVYARGAQDNKGQCAYVLEALKLWRKQRGKFPINIKWCIEGEEEMGSPSLYPALQQRKAAMKADIVAIVDLGIPSADRPVLTLGVRGIVTMELTVKESNTDLHSGMLGGIVQNPLHVLSKMIASLHDEEGKVTVPGFYDDVEPVSPEEKKRIDLSFDEEFFTSSFGASPLGGETAFSPLERAWTRPTLEVNGMHGGYTGKGFKTVIPAKAHAKISCRLVPHQDPGKIGRLVADHLKKLAPPGIAVWADVHEGGGPSVRTDPANRGAKVFSQAYTDVFGKPCRFILEGGSIPIVPELAQAADAEIVMLGLGLPTDRIHAPNEHFGWDRFEKGVLIFLRALELFENSH